MQLSLPLQIIADQEHILPILVSMKETGAAAVKEKAGEVHEKLVQLVKERKDKGAVSGDKYDVDQLKLSPCVFVNTAE